MRASRHLSWVPALLLLGCNQLLGNEEGELGGEVEVLVPEQGIPGEGLFTVRPDTTTGNLTGMGWFIWHGDGGGVIPNGYTSEGQRTTCKQKKLSACTVTSCSWQKDPSVVLNKPQYVSAGTLTAKCGAGAAVPATLDAGKQLYKLDAGAPCAPGEKVTISASGDVAPAFSAEVAALSPTALLTPNPKADLALSRSGGLSLTWNPSGGSLLVTADGAVSGPDSGESWYVHCQYDAAAGSGTVPPAALAKVPLLTQLIVNVTISDPRVVTPNADWRIGVSYAGLGVAELAHWETLLLE